MARVRSAKKKRKYVEWIDLNIFLILIAVIMSWPKWLKLTKNTGVQTKRRKDGKKKYVMCQPSDEYFSIDAIQWIPRNMLRATAAATATPDQLSCFDFGYAYEIYFCCCCCWYCLVFCFLCKNPQKKICHLNKSRRRHRLSEWLVDHR